MEICYGLQYMYVYCENNSSILVKVFLLGKYALLFSMKNVVTDQKNTRGLNHPATGATLETNNMFSISSVRIYF